MNEKISNRKAGRGDEKVRCAAERVEDFSGPAAIWQAQGEVVEWKAKLVHEEV